MVEIEKEEFNQIQFDFSFLKNEPHSKMEELFILNNGTHLTNYLVEHRKSIKSDINKEAARLEIGDEGKRICRLIIEEIERVGGGKNYRDLPEEFLDEGRRQAMVSVTEVWDVYLNGIKFMV